MPKTSKLVKSVKSTGLSVPLYDISGKETGAMSLPKDIFSTKANKDLLAQYIHVYRTNQRQGTASTKTRAEVNKTTKKIYRQKGTGRARHGAKSAPIFVGGGVTFGPRPRTFHASVNKKQRRQALFGALTLSLKEHNIVGLSDKAFTIEPKTKNIAQLLKKIEFEHKKVLFVFPKMENSNLTKAVRNIDSTSLIDAKSLNAYEVLNANKIMFVESALPILVEHFGKKV